ncbi:MAG: hypothetical protein J6K39_00830 [Clostridia bacterium]|nr:hypothetical protein [Clostridia bacterium]
MNRDVIKLIKADYLSQLKSLFSDKRAVRNENLIKNCVTVNNSDLGVGANADIGENTLEYGDYADECTIFHELDHIRKGASLYTLDSDTEMTNSKKVKFSRPRHGIFLDEAITEYVATYMFRNSKYFQPAIDQLKLNSRVFYKEQIKVLNQMANALGIKTLELCNLIDMRHHFGDTTIDKKFEAITGDKDSFVRIEVGLDYYGTTQYIDYQCSLGNMKSNDGVVATGIDERCQKQADKFYDMAMRDLEKIKQQRILK